MVQLLSSDMVCPCHLMLSHEEALWTNVDSRSGIPRQSRGLQKQSTCSRNGYQLAPRVLHTVAELLVTYHRPLHLVQAVDDR